MSGDLRTASPVAVVRAAVASCAALAATACATLGPVEVDPDVLRALPRESRVLLRDADQEVVIAQWRAEEAREQLIELRSALAGAERQAAGPVPEGAAGSERDVRAAERDAARALVEAAEADRDAAEVGIEVARARRDHTVARVLRLHQLISAKKAALAEREARVAEVERRHGAARDRARAAHEAAGKVAAFRDRVLDRHLGATAERVGWPWTR